MDYPLLPTAILVSSGLCWTLTYLIIIWQSHKDNTYGMPIAACIANIVWEFYYAFIAPWNSLALSINIIWLFLDLIILFQILKFAPLTFKKLSRHYFYILVACGFLIAIFVFHYSEQNNIIEIASAFASNLMMSALFVVMLISRGNSKGQHLYIAILKGIGTLEIIILVHFIYRHYQDNTLLHVIFISIIILDIAYILLLYRQLKKENKNPWLLVVKNN